MCQQRIKQSICVDVGKHSNLQVKTASMPIILQNTNFGLRDQWMSAEMATVARNLLEFEEHKHTTRYSVMIDFNVLFKSVLYLSFITFFLTVIHLNLASFFKAQAQLGWPQFVGGITLAHYRLARVLSWYLQCEL